MKLAIQEDMLPGTTPLEKCEQAKALGIQGIEYWGAGLTTRVPDIVDAIQKTGVQAAAVNYGTQGQLIEADRPVREAALAAFRDSVVNAVDMHAAGVIVVPHYGAPTVPDLTPYKSVIQLQHELLHNHLRTLSDYVYAIGVDFYIQPVNRYESQFINTLADAVRVRRRIKDHPHVKIAPDTFHMALEEIDPAGALRECVADIGYMHVADSNRRLPGRGLTDFVALATVLREGNYDGWVTLSCGQPGHNAEFAKHILNELPASIEVLKKAGF
ncbi:MAG: sugar phosphate isomerase/epimerase family protein [Chloroflexota bacterium]